MSDLTIFEELESSVRYYCRQTPNLFATAQGAKVWDADGNEFIDFLAGCGSLNLGHNHPAIKRALISYLEQDGIGNALDFHTRAKRDFMEAFRDVILRPRKLPYVLQFTGPTGTNCVEVALKLARKATGRRSIAAFTNAFHGMSMGAMAATGSSKARRRLPGSTDGVVRLPFDGYHGAGLAELNRFAEMVLDPSGGIEPIAAIIVETVQGEGGLNVASEAWLRRLRQIATDIGALLIVDDIQAGCGRTGDFFSFERAGIVPDIVCLSKSISGAGLPMALLLALPQFDVWCPGEHNGTFRGNNLAFVTAAAAIDLWRDGSLAADITANSAALKAWLADTARTFAELIERRRGLGMMVGLQFRNPAVAKNVADQARADRLLIETCGPYDEVIKIFPPLNIELDLLEEGLERLHRAIVSEHKKNAFASRAA
ncbi:diaminobutyrate--2-oxoglutarate transaminase [Bradyrhizobium ottawaense]|uniref:diaminobutyrate--2-oxoglutarate transaminase n=1 Tax=Bradyrhizobium ottawaense TaxID=931866 RepID=UPI000BE95475|nr:diaminobutyrate--2-oxoglutarate transaminase [Bradyrhizobium ottawaense]PDT64542.1 diaminobutyrate--2-oxoglutarate transaminase [Bradyrhizobium ottawaense]